jgi:hypothetical protein
LIHGASDNHLSSLLVCGVRRWRRFEDVDGSVYYE